MQELNCTVKLNRTISGTCTTGSCPGNWNHRDGGCPWGCASDPQTMFSTRGCCGMFECDGAMVECCSHQHKLPTLCECGTKPSPIAAGTFYVDASALPGGNGSAAFPFTTIGACTAYAARAT